jgi:hypothetical protein
MSEISLTEDELRVLAQASDGVSPRKVPDEWRYSFPHDALLTAIESILAARVAALSAGNSSPAGCANPDCGHGPTTHIGYGGTGCGLCTCTAFAVDGGRPAGESRGVASAGEPPVIGSALTAPHPTNVCENPECGHDPGLHDDQGCHATVWNGKALTRFGAEPCVLDEKGQCDLATAHPVVDAVAERERMSALVRGAVRWHVPLGVGGNSVDIDQITAKVVDALTAAGYRKETR